MSTSWVKKVLLLLFVVSAFGVFSARGRRLAKACERRPGFSSVDKGLQASARARKELAFVTAAQGLNDADDVICLCGCVGCGCSVDESLDVVLADEMHEILSDALYFCSSRILSLLAAKNPEAIKFLVCFSTWMKNIESERAIIGSSLLDLLITDQPILGPKGYGIDCVKAVNVIDINKFVNTTIGVGFEEFCERHKDDSHRVVSLIKDFCECFRILFHGSPQMQALMLFVQMFDVDVKVVPPVAAASSSRAGLPPRTATRALPRNSRQVFMLSPAKSESSAGSLGSLVGEFASGWGFFDLGGDKDSCPALGEAVRDSDESDDSTVSADLGVSVDSADKSSSSVEGFAFCMPRASEPTSFCSQGLTCGRSDEASLTKKRVRKE